MKSRSTATLFSAPSSSVRAIGAASDAAVTGERATKSSLDLQPFWVGAAVAVCVPMLLLVKPVDPSFDLVVWAVAHLRAWLG